MQELFKSNTALFKAPLQFVRKCVPDEIAAIQARSPQSV